MSKASVSTKFRRVDVDEIDENQFCDEQSEDVSSSSGPDEGEVNSLLASYPLSTLRADFNLTRSPY